VADDDLTRLGPTEFEHLAQALAVWRLGPSLRVFGVANCAWSGSPVYRP